DLTRGLSVIEFTDVSRDVLRRFKTDTPPDMDLEGVFAATLRNTSRPHVPQSIVLRDYQERAINAWFQNNGTGILEMATGTGKTFTALGIATRLYERLQLQALIVICPFKHLVTQWEKDCKRFGMDPMLAYESRTSWFDELTRRLSGLQRDVGPFL